MQVSHSKPYTWQMYCLGRYYHDALIGIEVNFNTAPIEELSGCGTCGSTSGEVYDTYKNKKMERHGWKTDGNTRPLIIDKEVALVEEHIELFHDIPTLQEC